MNHLIRTEWLKIKKYKAFWWIFGLTALSYPGINYIFLNVYHSILENENRAAEIAKSLIGNPFTFPEVWHTVAYFSSWFVFIPAVIVIMFITNEYSFKTHRQNIIDGWSRKDFLMSKFLDVLLLSFLIMIMYIIVCIVIGYANISDGNGDVWGMFYYAGLFVLQTFAQLSIAFMIGFLIRKAFIALGVFLFYYMVFEPILVGISRVKLNDIGEYLPLEISDRLIPMPAFIGKINSEGYKKSLEAINIHILYTVLLTAIIWWLCFRINDKRDL